MERAIQIYAVINFTVIGLSHALQPQAWVEFFTYLRERGRAGVFAVAFMSLWFGSLVVAFHNVWSGIPVVLTVVGWAQVAKGLIYFSFPTFALRQLARPTPERSWIFIPGGIVFLVLAGLLAYHLATGSSP